MLLIYERGGKTEEEDAFLPDFKVKLNRLGILNPATYIRNLPLVFTELNVCSVFPHACDTIKDSARLL